MKYLAGNETHMFDWCLMDLESLKTQSRENLALFALDLMIINRNPDHKKLRDQLDSRTRGNKLLNENYQRSTSRENALQNEVEELKARKESDQSRIRGMLDTRKSMEADIRTHEQQIKVMQDRMGMLEEIKRLQAIILNDT